jgi:NADH-quinone oxidoreductase subunit L
MLTLLWLIPAFCLAGFLILAVLGGLLPRRGVAMVGVGSVALSTLAAFLVGATFLAAPPPGNAYTQTLRQWMSVSGFSPRIALYLDALSLVMVLVVTFVSLLIHLYSAEFMIDDEGYSRFFAYMNLFVASMLTLVLADNLVLLYLGWEGVGLCSYLLIGFWYTDPANGAAAQKAFIVTRIGDTAMAIGLFLLFTRLGTLDIQALMQRVAREWPSGSGPAAAAAILLLGGALGKSAQLPLQTWLPDAMAGPTPVSALIHAATMVTAGVYLIARTHVLFAQAPAVQLLVGVIGAATLLLAGCSALTQRDIKRVLAYSTISQIGYMFLALGVGAWGAAMFHFMTHAFFKALLFLAAGIIIQALHHEHDIFRMGGLRKELPLAFWTFLVGGASLSAVPLVTAGFYSKDLILAEAWSSGTAGHWLWAGGWIGALLTSLYTFRVVFVAFFGEAGRRVEKRPGAATQIPLVILAAFALAAGFLETPGFLGHVTLFSRFISTALPAAPEAPGAATTEVVLELLAMAASLGGIGLAYFLFTGHRRFAESLARSGLGSAVHRFWLAGWDFDRLYDTLLVRPFCQLAWINRDDIVDSPYRGAARLSLWSYHALRRSQTGRLRWYATAIATGSVVIAAIALLL